MSDRVVLTKDVMKLSLLIAIEYVSATSTFKLHPILIRGTTVLILVEVIDKEFDAVSVSMSRCMVCTIGEDEADKKEDVPPLSRVAEPHRRPS